MERIFFESKLHKSHVLIRADAMPIPSCQRSMLPGKHLQVCDGFYDCKDLTDESGCSCPETKFTCACYETGCSSRWGCIFSSWRCDGYADCSDHSDEMDCHCSHTMFQCKNGDCIHRSLVNDGERDCVDGDDEFSCGDLEGHFQCSCPLRNGHCASPGRCIPGSWVGDTNHDCSPDGNDEPCNATKSWCGKCMIIVNRCFTDDSKDIIASNSKSGKTRCIHIHSPDHHEGIFTPSEWVCVTSGCGHCLNVFTCENGQIVDWDQFCDGVFHCDDRSDEEASSFGFRCYGTSRGRNCVLPQRNVYDSAAQCADSSDLCFEAGEFRCFLCLDGKQIVSARQICDGFADCQDMSDECLCPNQTICNQVFHAPNSSCSAGEMLCENNNNRMQCAKPENVLCNASVNCKDEINLRFCHSEQQSSKVFRCKVATPNGTLDFANAVQCDGRPECGYLSDECQCSTNELFCQGFCHRLYRKFASGNRICDGYINKPVFPYSCGKGRSRRYAKRRHCRYLRRWFNRTEILDHCSHRVERNCTKRFYCRKNSMLSIDERSVCDGILDCDDRSDENNTACLHKRFACAIGNRLSISKNLVCDGIKDCDDGEDEAKKLCSRTRFYCESGEPISVDVNAAENGIKDCSDGSDECASFFSDRYEMIANPLLRGLFWTMGFVAMCGNILVNSAMAKGLFRVFFVTKPIIRSPVKVANSIFICNLTISDFLMSVYLIGIASQSERFSGFYCLMDKQWRSSNVCSGLSTLVIVSSETTVFLMAAMSTLTLMMVFRPFLTTRIKPQWIFAVSALCWLLSITLATIPWCNFESGYFISSAWLPNVFWNTDVIPKADVLELAKKLPSNIPAATWSEAKTKVLTSFKYLHLKGEFGYYSNTSVCMPHIYTSGKQNAWEYSTFLVTLNFVMLVYTTVAYVFVFKKSGGMKTSRCKNKALSKCVQKRISRVMITDCCCWIPVCIMAYLSLAGVPLPANAYITSAGFLLPINSAMNPVLYSKFVDRQWSIGKNWIMSNLSKTASWLTHKMGCLSRPRTRSGEQHDCRSYQTHGKPTFQSSCKTTVL